MKQLEGFSHRHGKSSRYPFPKMAEQLGTVWELRYGEDYESTLSVVRAAHAWARRRGLKAVTSTPTGAGTVEIMFMEKEEGK